MKKAGNLQHLYTGSTSEFCVVFDADFTPRSDFLAELMPYFDDPSIGIVQSPQFFETSSKQGWLERGACTVQEFFYRLIQTSREQRECAICVGTNAIYRRAALDTNGGTTQIPHSEDVHTGFDLRRRGWKLLYVPSSMASGICPDDKRTFFSQQYRWCTGSMSLMASRKFWAMPMSGAARCGYLSGFAYYIMTAITIVVAPLIPLLLVSFYPQLVRLENYVLLLPVLIYQFIVFPLWHRQRPRLGAWTVQFMYSWAHLIAVLDFARGRSAEWQPTGKVRSASGGARALNWLLLGWSGGTALLLFVVAAFRAEDRPEDFLPMLVLSAFVVLVVGRAFVPERGR
jgi:cellulose synthase (UDP-forming)